MPLARRIGLALAAVALTAVGAGRALEVPYLTARVNDTAGMLSPAAVERIETTLAAFEESTGSQVAVLTIATLENEVLEEFSLRVAETWGLGREGVDDGVLFLVVRDDRKMRIEVGYGLEPQLTDAESGRILRNVVRPYFQRGEFDGGIEAGVQSIIGGLRGAEVAPDGTGGDQPLGVKLGIFGFFAAIMSVFVLNALFSSGFGSWFLYVFLMPFMAAFPGALFGPRAGMIALTAWVIGFPLAKLLIRKTPAGRRWVERHPGWTSWSSGSGGGFSGGGFSGGGGSFGGGGASSSW